jgi:hypothetical protein
MDAARSPLVGRAHPQTSHAAAESVRGLTATLRERVFRAVQAAGAEGLTADEIEVATSLGGNTVRPRIDELRKEGRIGRTEMQRPTRSGRNAFVYVALERTEALTGRVCAFCKQPEPMAGGAKGGGEWRDGWHLHDGGRVYAAGTPAPALDLEF